MENSLGSLIRNKRKKQGYRLEQAAALVGIRKQELNAYEKGHSQIDLDLLERISDGLQIRVPQLLEAYLNDKLAECQLDHLRIEVE